MSKELSTIAVPTAEGRRRNLRSNADYIGEKKRAAQRPEQGFVEVLAVA